MRGRTCQHRPTPSFPGHFKNPYPLVLEPRGRGHHKVVCLAEEESEYTVNTKPDRPRYNILWWIHGWLKLSSSGSRGVLLLSRSISCAMHRLGLARLVYSCGRQWS